jgi:uncharacterized protein
MAADIGLMSDFSMILKAVLSQYRLQLNATHGISHWARVLENGRRLAPVTGATVQVVELFAILHDSQREKEGGDHDHGHRAAQFVSSLRGMIDLPDSDFRLLLEACDCHTRGADSNADVTVLTCLDSDRLDIPRVGMRIKTELLYTEAAKDPDILRWASTRAERRIVPDLVRTEWQIEDSIFS